MFTEGDCAQLPGPKWYAPKSVPEAFDLLRSVSSEADAKSAYDTMLFAVGNNHCGTLYPVATAAVHEILRIAADRRGWARSAALEILGELLRFEPEPGFATFERNDGTVVNLSLEIVRAVYEADRLLLEILESPDSPECDRENALSALDTAHVGAERISKTVRSMLNSPIPPPLKEWGLAYLKGAEEARLAEDAFIQRIRHELRVEEEALTRTMITQACWLSPNAAFAIVREIAQAPIGSPASSSARLAYLDIVASELHHPLVTTILPIARRILEQRFISPSEAVVSMREVARFPGQEEALRIAAFCSDRGAAEVEHELQRIRDQWLAQTAS